MLSMRYALTSPTERRLLKEESRKVRRSSNPA
jgi:hypothetical protein